MLCTARLHVTRKVVAQNVTRIHEVENLTRQPRIFRFILTRV